MRKIHYLMTALALVTCACGCANSGKKAAKDVQQEKEIIVLDTLTRSSLVKLPINEQTEVLGKVTPEVKAGLFRYKLTKDLESGSLDEKESALIQKLKAGLSAKIYTDSTAKAEFNGLAQDIAGKLREECGWDDGKLFQYTETVMTAAESAEFMKQARQKQAEMQAKGYDGK